MPRFGPVKRTELIDNLRKLGFAGPFAAARHEFMLREDRTLTLPYPHQADLGTAYLIRIITASGLAREDWERL
jgi:hypothetical protein